MYKALNKFIKAVRKDFVSVQHHRMKYNHDVVADYMIVFDVVRKIGFQMTTVVRLMQLMDDLHIPVAPQMIARLMRYVYSSEIHWDAKIDPGLSIIHGTGLIIGHAVQIEEGCILFHNVTLGEGVDKQTRKVGSPHLGPRVHVGPGATLLGPIHVGEGSKIMAGAVLTQSVPAYSLVKPADVVIEQRRT